MRFRLRTLMIVLAIGPMVLAGGYYCSTLGPTMGSRASPVMATSITVRFFNEAINSYRDHVGELPPDLESLLKPPRNLPDATKWGGPYLGYEELPLDPWRGTFQYEVLDHENGKFRVWSKGPDGFSRTKDDINGW